MLRASFLPRTLAPVSPPATTPRRDCRKACRRRFHLQLPQIQRSLRSPRTCFEGPFGEVIRATGPMSKANPFRFSTKYQDDETDLLYYGYRYYSASTGRWSGRDPIEERGGMALYALLNNDPIGMLDVLGLLHAKQTFDVKDGDKLLGRVRVAYYTALPFDKKVDLRTKVGAQLRIDPVDLEWPDCTCLKWRQHFSQLTDNHYDPAPDRDYTWKYLPVDIKFLNDVLDMDYKAPVASEWFPNKDAASYGCAYSFKDEPDQYPNPDLFTHNPTATKVTVAFRLELVKVDCNASGGGTTLLTIRWGFWYTKTAHGLLNED
jgi:RHS repeat-associated protein